VKLGLGSASQEPLLAVSSKPTATGVPETLEAVLSCGACKTAEVDAGRAVDEIVVPFRAVTKGTT
jgi:hypothetical protein